MVENRIAVIGKPGAGCGTLALEIQKRITEPMDIFHANGIFYGWYDLYLWDRKFMEMSPAVIAVDSDYEQHFQEGYKTWKGIVLLVDGEAFDVQAADKEDYINQVSRKLRTMGQLDLLLEFAKVDKAWELPPVCVNVTKQDVIEECWKCQDWTVNGCEEMIETLHEIIKDCYKLFFDDTFPNRYGTTISTTSWDAEQVMFFMMYSAFAVVMDQKRKEWDAARTEYQKLEDKLFKTEKIRKRMLELLELNSQLKGQAYYIRKAVDVLSVFWENAPKYYDSGMEQTIKTYLWARTCYFDFYSQDFSKDNDSYFYGVHID